MIEKIMRNYESIFVQEKLNEQKQLEQNLPESLISKKGIKL